MLPGRQETLIENSPLEAPIVGGTVAAYPTFMVNVSWTLVDCSVTAINATLTLTGDLDDGIYLTAATNTFDSPGPRFSVYWLYGSDITLTGPTHTVSLVHNTLQSKFTHY